MARDAPRGEAEGTGDQAGGGRPRDSLVRELYVCVPRGVTAHGDGRDPQHLREGPGWLWVHCPRGRIGTSSNKREQ